MKSKGTKNVKSDKAAIVRKKKVPAANRVASNEDFSSELSASRWSVVSFETRLASGLTYDEAVKKLNRARAKKVSGLCIITDEAAGRIKN